MFQCIQLLNYTLRTIVTIAAIRFCYGSTRPFQRGILAKAGSPGQPVMDFGSGREILVMNVSWSL